MRAGEARRTLTLRLFIWSLIVTGCVYQTVVIPSSSSGVQQKLTGLEKALCPSLHYGIKAMGAMTLRISELYLSFSPHPNISDGNFNLVHHFFRIQIFQINEKGSR